MNEQKTRLVNDINCLTQDLLNTGKMGQVTFFEKLKDQIRFADAEKFQELMTQISTMAPLSQYAGFSLEEERKLYLIIETAINYLHSIKGNQI